MPRLFIDPATGWAEPCVIVRSPNFDARPAGAVIDLVIIHGISLPPGEFGGCHVDELFTNCLDPAGHPYFAEIADLAVSSHFLIGRDGRLTQYVSVLDRAWHAGDSSWCGRPACNDYAVGIELEGTDTDPYDPAQYAVLSELLAALMMLSPAISADRVVGHSDVAPLRKTDPGPAFDWARLREELAARRAGEA